MVELDPRSVAYAAATVGFFLLILVCLYWWNRKTYPGFGDWLLSLALLVGALTAISWARYFPAWLAEMAINAASVGAMVFAASGAHRFFLNRPLDRWTVRFFGAGLLLTFLVQFSGPDILHAAVGGLVMGGLAFRAAFLFLSAPRRGQRLVSGICAALLVSMVIERFWRASFFVTETTGQPMMDPHLAALINHSFNAVFIALWAFSFVVVNASRIELDLRESRTELKHLADRDALTQLRNRRAFMREVEQQMQRAQANPITLSLLIIDLDRFKRVNDRWGHPVGDQVLTTAAAIISDVFPPPAKPARVGGEEFAILLADTDEAGALDAAERIRQRIADQLIIVPSSRATVTASIGVGQWQVERESLSRFYARVDAALYAAKRAGRNQVRAAKTAAAAASDDPDLEMAARSN